LPVLFQLVIRPTEITTLNFLNFQNLLNSKSSAKG
jgi:hypothetical protein